MAIADTINSIRTHLTADYESLENIGAELENVDKNIENIASVVNGIYDTLPKTTGEGTSLSLNTLKGKMNTTLKGDTQQDGTPTPDTPIDIEVVTGTQEVKVENVNLVKPTINIGTHTQNGLTFVINENGTFSISGVIESNNSITFTIVDYFDFSKYLDQQMTLSCGYNTTGNVGAMVTSAFNKNKQTIAGNVFNIDNGNSYATKSLSSTTYPDLYYIAWRIYMPSNKQGTSVNIKGKLQLEKGSTATPFTPHQEQVQTISLGDIELCKIGNYQDYLYKSNDKWYKKKQIGKVVLNGSETISAVDTSKTNTTRVAYWNILTNSPAIPYSTTYKGFSNYFTIENIWDIDIEGLYTNREAIIFRVSKSIGTNASGIATWLSTHNVEVYYVLAAPNDIEITNETLIAQLDSLEKLKSYNGVTNISSSGNLAMVLSVSALKGE